MREGSFIQYKLSRYCSAVYYNKEKNQAVWMTAYGGEEHEVMSCNVQLLYDYDQSNSGRIHRGTSIWFAMWYLYWRVYAVSLKMLHLQRRISLFLTLILIKWPRHKNQYLVFSCISWACKKIRGRAPILIDLPYYPAYSTGACAKNEIGLLAFPTPNKTNNSLCWNIV